MALLMVACSNDTATDNEEPLPEGMGRIRITICSPETVGGSTTRAVNATPWEDPDHEWEKLQTFRILICKAENNEVVQIITGGKTQMSEATTLPSTYKSATVTSYPLEAGSYYIYATANFADGYSVGGTFDPNETVKFANGYSATLTDFFGDVRNIPMTGKLTTTPGGNELREVGVANGITTDVTDTPLTVWRVVGKLQFEFFNETTQKVTIKGIEVEPINQASATSGGVYLFSKDDLTSEANLVPLFPSGTTKEGVSAKWNLTETPIQNTAASVSMGGVFESTKLSWGSKLSATEAITTYDNVYTLQKFQPTVKVTGQDADAVITFSVTPKTGITFTPRNLSFKACTVGTDGGNFDVVAGGNIVVEGGRPSRYNGAQGNHEPPFFTNYSYSLIGTPVTSEYVVKIYIYNLDTNKQYAFRDVVVSGDVTNNTGSTIQEHITLPAAALTDVGPVVYTPSAALELNAGVGYDATANPTKKLFFYVNETDASYTTINNQFSLRFKIQRGDGPEEEIRYGMTTPYIDGLTGGNGFNVIRRNDWIHIPIHITDWQLRIEPLAFVPIAGYPATTLSSDGLNATFSTGGMIALQPFVKKYDDSTWRDFGDTQVTFVSLTWKNSDGTDISGNDKIVKTPFAYDPVTKCIIGELNQAKVGHDYKTTLTVNLKLGLSTGVQYDYIFTFNIVLD
jgi:hypothetical protein